MLKKIIILSLVFMLALVSFQCKKKAQIEGITLDVAFSEENLSDYLITDMTYTWKTTDAFVKMEEDMNVFVHFWHNNNLLLQDDHMPEVFTSQWEPGNEYSYTRRIFIPTFIDEFDPDFSGEESLKLTVGLVSPYDPTGKSKKEVLEERLKVTPPPLDTPEIIYEKGWYDLEENPEAYLKRWRWTAKEALCLIDNPKRDALLVIKGGVNLEALEDQSVVFKINDLIIDSFKPDQSEFERSYDIKKEMLGEGDEFTLTISTDKTFIPAQLVADSSDERELGLQISFIYFR
jgi:hypothetical protein